jgi:1-acyl-sn-glycerol-3-phosphate acyltransferase
VTSAVLAGPSDFEEHPGTGTLPPEPVVCGSPDLTPEPGPVTCRAAGHPTAPADTWVPVSPCTADCLPDPAGMARVCGATVAGRLAGLVAVLLAGALLTCLTPLVPPSRRAGTWRSLFRAMLRACGIRLVVRGGSRLDAGPGAGGVMVVANHLSWLDIVALGAVQPMRMLAKREIREWPLFGALAARAGTLFVDRSRLRTLPTVIGEVAEALRGGALVGVFPEGTTWCGVAGGTFRRAGFQAALDAGVPVRPVALGMRTHDGAATTVGCFVGEDTLVASLRRVLRLPEMVIEVDLLPLLPTGPHLDRRTLAEQVSTQVSHATGTPRPAAPAAGGAAPAVEPVTRPAAGPGELPAAA